MFFSHGGSQAQKRIKMRRVEFQWEFIIITPPGEQEQKTPAATHPANRNPKKKPAATYLEHGTKNACGHVTCSRKTN